MKLATKLASIALVVLLSACGGAAQQITPAEPVVYQLPSPASFRTDLVTYSDPNYPFVVQLPREWYAGELSTADGIVATNTNQPGQPRAAISIVAEPIQAGATIDEVITAAEDVLRAQAGTSNFRLELDRQATVNGIQGRERRYRFVTEGQTVRQRTIYLLGTDTLYAMSFTAPQDVFAQHEATFNDVLLTFEGS